MYMMGVTLQNIGCLFGNWAHSPARLGPYTRLNSCQMLNRQATRLSSEGSRGRVRGLVRSRAYSSRVIRPNRVRASLSGTPQSVMSWKNACSAAGLIRLRSISE